MPANLSYPGVYIEEVQSAVRTITGVATSITAFVGRALRGPIDQPRRISSFGDFERKYGGLWLKSTLSYAVQQYFLNGGTDAIIARVVHAAQAAGELAATASRLGSATGSERWTFQASAAGASGNSIALTIRTAASAPDDTNLFDITITNGTDTDVVSNVDVTALHPGDALGAHALVVVEGLIPAIRPNPVASLKLAGGADATFATVSVGGESFSAATIGAGGNQLVARVTDSTDADPTHYNLSIQLLDDDGDLLATALFEDVAAGAAWPAPTLSNTTDSLVDTSAVAPARPANGVATFDGGANFERATAGVAITIAGLPLSAANPGSWGNRLQAAFDLTTSDPSDASLFNAFIRELDEQGQEVTRETFRNVSVNPDHKRFVQKVLEEESDLVRLVGSGPWTTPPETPVEPISASSPTRRFQWLSFSGGQDGEDLIAGDYLGSQSAKTGLYLLEKTDLFNLLVIPPPTRGADTDPSVWIQAMKYCKDRRAMLLVDAPAAWTSTDDVTDNLGSLGVQGSDATNAAMYWPQLRVADPLREYRLEHFPPGGAVAGLMARTDAQLGVWRAPAGVDASLTGARALSASVTDAEQGRINPLGVNVVRAFPVIGAVSWGARTLRGADVLADQWKYVPVRRLALMIEESLYRGTQWAVFGANDEPLWAQLRLNIGTFMSNLFRQGAFQGTSPRDAYSVKCDAETTTQADIDRGIVNVLVGFRPLKPAEFVVLKISQLAGQVGS